MNEINCPECGKLFKIDESVYTDLLKQVRDNEFDAELICFEGGHQIPNELLAKQFRIVVCCHDAI